jgi:hypothetical protein
MTRWRATVTYRSEAGLVPVEYELAEIADLHDRVELGPHWDTIDQIVIVRAQPPAVPGLTVEAAEKL